MKPLFKLTNPNGQVIVGINVSPNNGTPIYLIDQYQKKVVIPLSQIDDYVGKRTIDGKIILGTISDITEEQAKKWGYKKKVIVTALGSFAAAIYNATPKNYQPYINNILLIQIEK